LKSKKNFEMSESTKEFAVVRRMVVAQTAPSTVTISASRKLADAGPERFEKLLKPPPAATRRRRRGPRPLWPESAVDRDRVPLARPDRP
jgi:hypothetical protein